MAPGDRDKAKLSCQGANSVVVGYPVPCSTILNLFQSVLAKSVAAGSCP